MATITLPHNWQPRPYQSKLWNALESGKKRCIEVAHRRWGKDDVALQWAAVSAMQRPATIWHMLPQIAMARKAIWTAVNPHTGKRRIDEAFPKAIRESTNETEMFLRLKNGSTWQVIGSDSYDTLVGSPPAGICFSNGAALIPRAGRTSHRSSLRTMAGRFSSRRRLAITTPRLCTTWPAKTLRGSQKYPRLQIPRRCRTKPSRFSAVNIMPYSERPQAMR